MVKDLETKFKYPICGSLRIGEKNEKNVPQKLDYFTVHKDTHTEKDVVEQFKSKFDKPKELTIRFISEEPFETQYLKYGRSGLLCKGDGESAITKGDEKWTECECSKECPFRGNKCKLTGKLFFLIRDIDIGGLWRLQTQSYNTIQNILTTLNFLKCMNVNITEHDFKLITEPKESIVDGKLNKFTTIKLKMVVNSHKIDNELKEESEKSKQIDTVKEEKDKQTNTLKEESNKTRNKKEVSKNSNVQQEKTEEIQKEEKNTSIMSDDYENCLTLVEIDEIIKNGKKAKKATFCTMKDDEKIQLLLHPDIIDEVCSWVPSSTILPEEIYEQNGYKVLKKFKEIEVIKKAV